MLAELGSSGSSYDPQHPPVAVFDWDNTVLKNDIGDATMFWMLNHDKIRQPPNKDWSKTNANLTPQAQAALNAACDSLAAPGEPLPTSQATACANEIYSIYGEGSTIGGQKAWNNEITLTINQAYAWLPQLQSGYTPGELRSFTEAAYQQNVSTPIGATQTVGTFTNATGYVRIYDQMKDLIAKLQANGFDVWIVSASPQHAVEVVAQYVGVPPNHVVGIRSVQREGKTTYDLEGCGPESDGENTIITFDQGKRCWINKVVYKMPAEAQLPSNPDPTKRPAFVGGDSDTDIAMLKDATRLKLAINRNKTQIMCNAYANYQASWLVQPMFIVPKGQKPAPYPCSTAKDATGTLIVDEAGHPMADQVDSIFALP